ncbi:hypothetical protein ACQPW1_22975 [Nocardia sp. CA-128927]|uniref:hypothetical protein n=1 Tax=Nocardia sp. CA-128927 TaxID=3239975 RepID=UPI003D993CD5
MAFLLFLPSERSFAMCIGYLTRKYHADLALVSRYTIGPAQVSSSCGGFHGIGGELSNGLTVWVSNDEMEGHDDTDNAQWTVGLHLGGGYVGRIETGSLAEQLAIAASLTVEQVRTLKTGSRCSTVLPEQIIVS